MAQLTHLCYKLIDHLNEAIDLRFCLVFSLAHGFLHTLGGLGMSALYQLRYQGVAGVGHGAVYIGRGIIVGVDITGGRYHGTYSAQGQNLVGSATLTSAGGTLVTGQPVPAGTQVPISFSLPTNFNNGQPHQISVGGRSVSVAFDLIGAVP